MMRLVALGVLGIYIVSMLWPYAAATLVRDGAVTAWTHLARAPIRGRLQSGLPSVGATAGAEGLAFEIFNEQQDPSHMLRAQAQLEVARARTAAASDYLGGVREIDDFRRHLRSLYAGQLRRELETEIAAREARIALLELKDAIATTLAQRTTTAAESGYRSRDHDDGARLRLAEAKSDLASERLALEQARLRRSAADEGVFYSADGSGPNWAYEQQLQSKIELSRAQRSLQEARLAEREAEHALEAATRSFQVQSVAKVTVPPGATIQSVIIGAGSAVQAGEPLATWIDCEDLYVDAPVSDAALPLIPIGSEAELILEGESVWRKARVSIVRGAAATIGAADLAAIAKGRSGHAQVLVKLDLKQGEFSACPIGRAAYVHFPSAGTLDVLLARLRMK